MISTVANHLVAAVRFGYRRKAWLSAGALLFTLVVAVAYLSLVALQVNPLTSTWLPAGTTTSMFPNGATALMTTPPAGTVACLSLQLNP